MTHDNYERDSAPCFAHHLVDGHPVDPDRVRDVARFRRAERTRLIAERALSSAERKEATDTLIEGLQGIAVPRPGITIAVYWPIRGEPDLRTWMTSAHAAGARIVLPVVVEELAPLEFQTWTPDGRMTRGFWNIPVPADGEPAIPHLVIVPLVGVDEALYRLGNGGGYFDRTLARIDPPPRKIGVGFAGCTVPTIYPMPWDVPMDEVLLSDGTLWSR